MVQGQKMDDRGDGRRARLRDGFNCIIKYGKATRDATELMNFSLQKELPYKSSSPKL